MFVCVEISCSIISGKGTSAIVKIWIISLPDNGVTRYLQNNVTLLVTSYILVYQDVSPQTNNKPLFKRSHQLYKPEKKLTATIEYFSYKLSTFYCYIQHTFWRTFQIRSVNFINSRITPRNVFEFDGMYPRFLRVYFSTWFWRNDFVIFVPRDIWGGESSDFAGESDGAPLFNFLRGRKPFYEFWGWKYIQKYICYIIFFFYCFDRIVKKKMSLYGGIP